MQLPRDAATGERNVEVCGRGRWKLPKGGRCGVFVGGERRRNAQGSGMGGGGGGRKGNVPGVREETGGLIYT